MKQGENVDIDAVGWNIIRNLVFLKFGINMLSPIDYHIKQICVSLQSIIKYGENILKTLNILEDFIMITKTIDNEFGKKMAPLAERQITLKNWRPIDLEQNYLTYINKSFKEDVKEILDIKIEELLGYEMPFSLSDMFQKYFTLFKGNFKGIIRSVHAGIAKDNKKESLLSESTLIKFEM